MLARTAIPLLEAFGGLLGSIIFFTMLVNFTYVVQFTGDAIHKAYLKSAAMPYSSDEILKSLRFLAKASLVFYDEYDRLPLDVDELKSVYKLKFSASFKEKFYAIDPLNRSVYCLSDKTLYKIDLNEGLIYSDLKKIKAYALNYFIKNGSLPDKLGSLKEIMKTDHYSYYSKNYKIDPAKKIISALLHNSRQMVRTNLGLDFGGVNKK